MNDYIVVSLDTDEMQWFYDSVLAASAKQAEEYICKWRPYVVGADALPPDTLRFSKATAIDATLPLMRCEDCESHWQESELKPIQDIHERVAPGERMPSGECPSCGALCHAEVLA